MEETRSKKYFEKALGRDVVLVAEEDSRMIGYVEFGPVNIAVEGVSDRDKELSRLYVLSDYQRKGIGGALMDAALAHPWLCDARNIYLDVWKKNEGAQKLYGAYGFTKTGQVIDGDIVMIRRSQSAPA